MKHIAENDFYSILVNPKKNRLYVKLIGFWKNPDLIANYPADIKKAIQELYRGFTMINDITEFKVPPTSLRGMGEEVEKMLVTAGGSKAAMVVPEDKALEKMAMRNVAQKSGLNSEYFSTIQEAENWLDE